LSVRRRISQPSWVDAAALKFGFNRVNDEFGRHHCKVVQRMIVARAAALPTVN
jgi:hypothetical protein